MAEKEYIGRNEFCKHFCRCREEQCDKSQCPIWTAPAADVAEVVHAEIKWVNRPIHAKEQSNV